LGPLARRRASLLRVVGASARGPRSTRLEGALRAAAIEESIACSRSDDRRDHEFDAAVAGARERGLGRMRLQTPAEHARARRFYEREGWESDGEPVYEPMLGLVLVTYRRELP
jgi:hypothetical protein